MSEEIKVSPSTGEILIGNKKYFGVDKDILNYITNLQKEVRINNDLIPYLKNKEKSLKKQLQQKENIIKELREYIESYMPNYDFDKTNLIKLLEILDKVEE